MNNKSFISLLESVNSVVLRKTQKNPVELDEARAPGTAELTTTDGKNRWVATADGDVSRVSVDPLMTNPREKVKPDRVARDPNRVAIDPLMVKDPKGESGTIHHKYGDSPSKMILNPDYLRRGFKGDRMIPNPDYLQRHKKLPPGVRKRPPSYAPKLPPGGRMRPY